MDPREAASSFDEIVRFAEADEDVLAFAVTGSRAVGFELPESDYDCALFVGDGCIEDVRDRLPTPAEGVDLRIFTPGSFDSYARWGSSTAWDRYAWSVADFRVDRTGGELEDAARAKGRVPREHVESHVDASIDWYLNQVARSLRCLAAGDEFGARLEAAESVRPFLQATFALHDRRVVPYYRYLGWEIERRPLDRLDVAAGDFVAAVAALVTSGSAGAQARVLRWAEELFRGEGFTERFEQWDTAAWWGSRLPARW